MTLIDRARRWIQRLLGIDKIQKELLDLRQENERLMELFKEHDKAITYIAIVHARAFKDIMANFKTILEPQKRQTISQKKPDDDLIN